LLQTCSQLIRRAAEADPEMIRHLEEVAGDDTGLIFFAQQIAEFINRTGEQLGKRLDHALDVGHAAPFLPDWLDGSVGERNVALKYLELARSEGRFSMTLCAKFSDVEFGVLLLCLAVCLGGLSYLVISWVPHQRDPTGGLSMSFYFVIDSVFVKKSRSKHKDTNYLVSSLLVNGSPTQTALFAFLHDQDSGLYQINQSLDFIDLGPGDEVIFNYMIVNAGSANAANVQSRLISTSSAWASGEGPNPANFTGALEDGDTFFTSNLASILNPKSCDGMVAAEQDHLSFDIDLSPLLRDQSQPHSVHQPGVRSPSGCGDNSDYTVNWHIFSSGDDDAR